MKKFKNMSKRKKIILIITILIVIGMIGISWYMYFHPHYESAKDVGKVKIKRPEYHLKTFDLESNKRPIAVMINNHNQARPYHSGLQDAQVMYEMIVEGGITRMLAVFKDADLSRIGPVRSARHYYLDYALENDAIYAHWGWSPQAESDISTLGVDNLNGLYDSGFTRDNSLIGKVNVEHTAITSSEGLNNAISKKGYRDTYKGEDVESELLLKYSVKEINIDKEEDSMVANNVIVPYSSYMTASYTYDSENKYYLRYANNVAHKDYITGEQYHFKNIIILKVRNYTIDSYGRQDLDNIGTGEGYFITNGYARPITWEKSSRSSKTVYKYTDGTEIKVNDGNTFIQIEPIDMTPSITEN